MYRSYRLDNRKTGEQRTLEAVSARDALAQVVGFIGIATLGLDFYSGDWHTAEPYPWWLKKAGKIININCNCGAKFSANYEDLHLVCTGGVFTCECGRTVQI